MNELEEMVFNSHAENLIKAKKRIKELESVLSKILEWYDEYGVILKSDMVKSKQILNKA